MPSRIWVGALVLAGASTAALLASRAWGCDAMSGRIVAEQKDAAEFTRASFDAELQKHGWSRFEGHEAPLFGASAIGSVTKGPDGADYLVTRRGDHPDAAAPTLVEDSSHALYVVDEHPTYVESSEHLICGCGPSGPGNVSMMAFGIRLSPEHPFKGHVPLAFAAKRVTLRWTNTENGKPCPLRP